MNLKTVAPESADSLDDDILDDAVQAFDDDSDTETFAGKIKNKNFFINLLFFLNKFLMLFFFQKMTKISIDLIYFFKKICIYLTQ